MSEKRTNWSNFQPKEEHYWKIEKKPGSNEETWKLHKMTEENRKMQGTTFQRKI